jgi:Gene Transfer Agent (GTA)-like protein/putative tail protein
MATLALAAAGAAIGSAVLPTGITLLGATITGATIGSQIGAIAGSVIDQALLGGDRQVEGPRLSELHITASTEGAPIPRIYGRARLGGQVIWATDFEEQVVSGSSGGGKGFVSGGASTKTYRYFANFAVAVAEGEISGIGRIWADGREIDRAQIAHRVYLGGETQEPDSLIVAREGAGNAPAYRGTAYIVFERLSLEVYGNRMPQLSFEVHRAVEGFNEAIRAVVMIPGSGEFAYAPGRVNRVLGLGGNAPENVHSRQGGSDWTVAVDQLEETLPNADNVSLIVSWFGTDLRAGHCELRPGVETTSKTTTPQSWKVAGATRSGAHVVSEHDGRAAYGGTPSDQSVVDAIRDLKDRDKSVTLTPFILMDVPEENALPNPYGGTGQPAYPWRGRITVHPAPGEDGSPDQTAAAATQIASFVGTAAPGDFALDGDAVVYSGPNEWSYRRMILHHAHLAKAAGGVDAFLIGTEMRGLTWVRDTASTYPFVAALVALAADVKAVLPDAKVTYAADWSEYFGHQPADGSGDVHFHLDPLWASADIDAIGIDVYWPLADWREGRAHLDYLAGVPSIYDLEYLRGNVQGGEGYDWYYASQEDRDAQVRSPITDGSGKPWVFRYKDIKSWWLNAHYDRPAGVESGTPTAWVPQSKPFWLMEIGCPAVDKGANQPNVFVDPKSYESHLPYYSRGTRDDLMQRRHLRALVEAFDPASDGYLADSNPISSVYGERMLDVARVYVYTWDARPYPAFPYNLDVWGDGDNWRLGHWLTGRFAAAPLAELVARILDDYGFSAYEATALHGVVGGYVIDRVMGARDALQPLELSYFFDALESGAAIQFRHRGAEPAAVVLTPDELVESRPGEALLTLTRGQETELPASTKIRFISTESDYAQAVAEARRLVGASGRVAQADLPLVLDGYQAEGIAEAWLFETWAVRERAGFVVPPSRLAIEPADIVQIDAGGASMLLRVTEVGERGAREIAARAIDPDVYGNAAATERPTHAGAPVLSGQPDAVFLDLPLLRGDEPPEAGYVAASQVPWPGDVAIYGSPEDTGFALRALAAAAATVGETLDDIPAGPDGRIDYGTRVRVVIAGEALASVTDLQMFAGQNVAAFENADGEWEVVQFRTATLVGTDTYELGELLRGQGGTEFAMRPAVAAGARFVLLNAAIARLDLSAAEIGLPYNWRVGPAARDIGDATYVAATHTFTGLGLKPLSPVHVRGTRSAGDVAISWIRRTRVGGDSWETSQVPLAEDAESYEVDVVDGETVVRTLASATPAVTYTAADQISDFGSEQPAYDVRVYQLSGSHGRGTARNAIV